MRMKRILFLTTMVVALFFGGCEKYDDSALTNRIDNLEERVRTLEELCRQMNTNISSLQTIVSALQNNDYVTGVAPITKNGVTIGYTITFTKSQPITIYHGENGKDGQNGTNGVDGKDGSTPVIGVKMDDDGIYYWTLNGEWLTDKNGNKVKAVGTDGKDGANGANGENGTNGKDGITPQLKIEEGYWFISYDNGATWTKLGKATGEDGKDGANGTNGTNGVDGDSFFQSVDTSNQEYVVFTLADGTEIQLPTWYAFEQLRTLCNQMNSNIEALQSIVAALQNNDYVTSVVPVLDNGKTIGYTINFSKSNPVTIYHGKDGQNGTNGTNGVDGIDGSTPVIGVKMDDDGVYYWTLNGEWLTDENGNKIKAVGADGKDGANGANGENGTHGKDGITPQLKIEEGYWLISYDNGATWTQLGKATGEDGAQGPQGEAGINGDSFFQSVTQDENNVYIVLADGTEITIPKQTALNISFSATSGIACMPGKSVSISYTISGGDNKTSVEALGDGGWSATVKATSKSEGAIVVTAPNEATAGKVIVLVSDGRGNVIMRSLNFEEGVLSGIEEAYEGDWEACTLRVKLQTNLDYTVEIPAEAQSWLSVAESRAALRNETLTFSLTENPDEAPRSASVKLIGNSGDVLQSFTIIQKLQPSDDYIVFADAIVKKVCVEKYDTNGDGEISHKEASKVTSIPSNFFGDYAVAVKSFDELQHFASVTSIRSSAFYNCSRLTSITIPESVTTIGDGAFNDCSSLTSITIPEGVTGIREGAFYRCSSLTSITLPEGVTEIGYRAFEDCSSLTSITIPEGVTSIGGYAFCGCSSLTSITIPEDVTSFGSHAFYGCSSLTSITIPEGVTSIGNAAFSGCSSLTSITIPESVTSIGVAAFSNCSGLTSITIPDGVTSIPYRAFDNCSSLTSITIPEGVTWIGSDASYNCSSLKEVYCKPTTPPNGGSRMFSSNASGRKIYVPASDDDSIINAYKTADYWKQYADAFEEYEFE